MPLPATGPTTTPVVKAYLQITDADDDDALDVSVAAVNALVRELPVADRHNTTDPDPAWSGSVVLGATMLAARLWRRKDSPAGVAAFGEFGPVYVQRNDPDVAMMLELGDYARPAIG